MSNDDGFLADVDKRQHKQRMCVIVSRACVACVLIMSVCATTCATMDPGGGPGAGIEYWRGRAQGCENAQ